MKPVAIILAAILTSLVGYFAASLALGATVYASQAATAGSVAAMAVFFFTFFVLKSFAETRDMKSKVRAITTNTKLRKDALGIDTQKNRRLAAIAQTAQRGLLIKSEVHIPKVRNLLLRAGKIGDRPIFITIITQVFLAMSGLALPHLLAAFGMLPGQSFMMILALGFCAGALGFYLPLIVLKSQGQARSKALFHEFPDALDLITIYVESGHTFDAALEKVAETTALRYPNVSFELRVLEHELRYFTDRKQAFRNLAERCDIDMVRRLAAIIEQNEQIGSSIADSLKILSQDSRSERLLEAERRAAKLPVLMQIPMVLFILPSLFLFILGPTAIKMYVIFEDLMK